MADNENFGFQFELTPMWRLRQAIEALCDWDFNPTGRGRIYVDGGGFSITACSPDNVLGSLSLAATGLHNFECRTPIMGNNFVDLKDIFANLAAYEFDTITVLHTAGSNHITFQLGEYPTHEFTAELHENNGEIPRFPNFIIFGETPLPSRDMGQLVDLMIQDGISELVTVNIWQNMARIATSNAKIPPMRYNIEHSGLGPGQWYQGSFYWSYPRVLKRAAYLGIYGSFYISFTRSPPQHVILRFSLYALGNLYFLKELIL